MKDYLVSTTDTLAFKYYVLLRYDTYKRCGYLHVYNQITQQRASNLELEHTGENLRVIGTNCI